jgi:hypothetical protein
MKLCKIAITAVAFAIGSVGMADAAMAARPRPGMGLWQDSTFDDFQDLCSFFGGESIGSLDPSNNGDVVCYLPDGTKITCDVHSGMTTNCRKSELQRPRDGVVTRPESIGPDSFTTRTSTSGISTSPRQTLSGSTATRS